MVSKNSQTKYIIFSLHSLIGCSRPELGPRKRESRKLKSWNESPIQAPPPLEVTIVTPKWIRSGGKRVVEKIPSLETHQGGSDFPWWASNFLHHSLLSTSEWLQWWGGAGWGAHSDLWVSKSFLDALQGPLRRREHPVNKIFAPPRTVNQ
jgi:hypothetical protein